MKNIIEDYKNIIKNYLNNKTNTQQFTNIYYKYYLDDHREFGGDLFNILDSFFADCDGYTEDTELHKLNPDFYINEKELRFKAINTLQKLDVLLSTLK